MLLTFFCFIKNVKCNNVSIKNDVSCMFNLTTLWHVQFSNFETSTNKFPLLHIDYFFGALQSCTFRNLPSNCCTRLASHPNHVCYQKRKTSIHSEFLHEDLHKAHHATEDSEKVSIITEQECFQKN